MKKAILSFSYNLLLFTASVFLLLENHDSNRKWKVAGSWIVCGVMLLFLAASAFLLFRAVKGKSRADR